MKIQSDLIEYISLSNADDIGRVFVYNGHIYRGIYNSNCDYVKRMFDCGLIEELIHSQMIPNTWITELYSDEFPLIIESELIHPVTYYSEWPAKQIYDAGQLVLGLTKIADEYGYSLKDCHPYNILYSKGKMLWCDLGSFIKGSSFPLQEFVAFYGTTIRLINKDPFYARCMIRMKHYPDVYNHFRILFGGMQVPYSFWHLFMRVNFGLAAKCRVWMSLLKRMLVCQVNVPKTTWSAYQEFSLDDVFERNIDDRFSRFSFLEKLIDKIKPKTIFEFAANRGVLACYLSQKEYINEYIASDYDEYAINELYKYLKNSKYPSCNKIVPLVVDFSEEHNHINVHPLETRVKSELVLACAVTHHLLLAQNINIDSMFEKFKKFTSKYLVVEFMPLGLWDGHNNPEVPEYYTLEWFKDHMSNFFNIKFEKQLEENRILLLGELNDMG